MTKKKWRIKDAGRGCFSLNRCGASFEFSRMGDFKRFWCFYHGEGYTGRLSKAKNTIVNLKDYAEKNNWRKISYDCDREKQSKLEDCA